MTRNSTCLVSPVEMRTAPSLVSTRTWARPVTVYDFVHSSAAVVLVPRENPAIARAATPANLRKTPLLKGTMLIVGAYLVWRSNLLLTTVFLKKVTKPTPERFPPPSWRRGLLLTPPGMFHSGRSRFCPQGRQKLLGRQGVQHICLAEPTAPCRGHAILDVGQVPGAVGIGRDHYLHAALLAHTQINVLQVQPVGIGVALHGHAVFGAGIEHPFEVIG